MKKLMEHYYIKEGFAEMDFDAVTRLLAATHWSHGISRAEVEKASSNSSLVVGIFNEADEQIGFARTSFFRNRRADDSVYVESSGLYRCLSVDARYHLCARFL